ncbi:MAG: YbaN family protein [Pseudolabrys sp.]|nr:YbaN family protein [Pseudolabrys sp.]
MRFMFFGLGCVMISLAVIGALLPVMPTTIFLILAAWCFGKSSPRLETWMLVHPRFGPGLRRWREEGAIAPRAKLMAVSGMAFGYALFWVEAKPGLLLAGVVAVFMLSSAAYVVSRPKPRRS